MEPFKNHFSYLKSQAIAEAVMRCYPAFDMDFFLNGLERELEELELKQRVSLLAARLEASLPLPIPRLFMVCVAALESGEGLRGFAVWPFTEVIAKLGGKHFPESMRALEEMTKRFTAEFAIRPFIREHREKTFWQLHDWCSHPDEHVRRLVSEGSRPLLPWGGNLPELLEPPYPTLDLLEKLHRDPSPYVRLSVANHLNDFSKHHADLVVEKLKAWAQAGEDDAAFQKLSRHACRTLLKEGHSGALALHGYGSPEQLEVAQISLGSYHINLGESLSYSLKIQNRSSKNLKVMYDYAIHLRKANQSLNAKVFKGRKKTLKPGETWEIHGKHSFREVTTRVYHGGIQKIEPRVNGKLFPAVEFHLEIPT